MRARVSGEWRCQPPEVTSVFCKGCVFLDFRLCLQWHSSSCALLVMHTWAWALAWEGLDLRGRCDSTMFNQVVELKGISSEQGIHFFEGAGQGEAAGQGRPGRIFAKGVCIHHPIGFLKVSPLPPNFFRQSMSERECSSG